MIGKRLAHFEIVGKLGEGGMGIVYEAIDQHLDRRVALKVLPPDKLAHPLRKQRFVQEAKAASALNHPNIVTIYDISADEGIDYIAMELVSGCTLEDALSRRRLRMTEALKWAAQIADALAAAHAAGIVHRDLKPANVIITESGLVKILDFGLAKLTEPDAPQQDDATHVLTEEGTVMGSAPYMSPEQAEGRKVDARSDIFSFGAVLYEMLTGKRAFRGDSRISTMAAILEKEPAPVTALAPEIPREIERIVNRCLRKDVARRSQSMAEIKLALDEVREETESGATAAPPPASTRPRRKLLWIGAGVALLILVTALYVLIRWPEAGGQLREVPLTSYTGFQGYPSLSPDGSQFAFSWVGDREDGPPQLYISLVGRVSPLRLTNYTDNRQAIRPVWSPDGQTIVFVSAGNLILIPALGGPEQNLGRTVGNSTPCWTLDGKWLYFSSPSPAAHTIAIFSQPSNGGERRQITDPPHGTGYGDLYPSVSPDGSRLAFVRQVGDFEADLFVTDLPVTGGRPPRQLTDRHEQMRSPVWMPDGKNILFAAGDSTANSAIYRVRASGGDPVRLAGIGNDAWDLTLSRNGKRLAYSRMFRDYNIWRMPLPRTGTAEATAVRFIASTRHEVSPAYSPDGTRIAFSSNRTGSRQIWIAESDGSKAMALTNFERGYAGSPRWSPDGTTIVFDGRPNGAADIYTISVEGGEPKRLTDNPAEDHLPCFSVDGRWIYFSSTRSGLRQIYRMPAAGGPAVQITRGGGHATVAVEGKWLYYTKPPLSVWKAPAEGGEEVAVITNDSVPFGGALEFGVGPSGIYFGERKAATAQVSLKVYRFSDGQVQELGYFEKPPFLHLGISPDEKWVLYTRLDSTLNDLMLVENFH